MVSQARDKRIGGGTSDKLDYTSWVLSTTFYANTPEHRPHFFKGDYTEELCYSTHSLELSSMWPPSQTKDLASQRPWKNRSQLTCSPHQQTASTPLTTHSCEVRNTLYKQTNKTQKTCKQWCLQYSLNTPEINFKALKDAPLQFWREKQTQTAVSTLPQGCQKLVISWQYPSEKTIFFKENKNYSWYGGTCLLILALSENQIKGRQDGSAFKATTPADLSCIPGT